MLEPDVGRAGREDDDHSVGGEAPVGQADLSDAFDKARLGVGRRAGKHSGLARLVGVGRELGQAEVEELDPAASNRRGPLLALAGRRWPIADRRFQPDIGWFDVAVGQAELDWVSRNMVDIAMDAAATLPKCGTEGDGSPSPGSLIQPASTGRSQGSRARR